MSALRLVMSMLAIMALVSMVLLPACRTTAPAPWEDSGPAPAPVAQTPPIIEMDQPLRGSLDLAPSQAVEHIQLFPPQPLDGRFAVIVGDTRGETFGYQFEPTDGQALWRWATEDRHVTAYRYTDQALVIPEEENLEENVHLTYEPAMLSLPSVLEVGQPVKQTSDVVVRQRDSGAERARGTTSVEVTLLGQARVVTPGGTFPAWIVRTHRTMDLNMADVEVVIHTAYAMEGPVQGPIARHIGQRQKTLGLFQSTTTEEIRLTGSHRHQEPTSISR